jgi:hypothetical protein
LIYAPKEISEDFECPYSCSKRKKINNPRPKGRSINSSYAIICNYSLYFKNALLPLRIKCPSSSNEFPKSFEWERDAGSNEYSEVDYVNLAIRISKYQQCASYVPTTFPFGDFMENKKNEFTAFVGVDWADCKHDVSIVSATGGKPIYQVVNHTPEDLNEWLTLLRKQYPEGQIAICLE